MSGSRLRRTWLLVPALLVLVLILASELRGQPSSAAAVVGQGVLTNPTVNRPSKFDVSPPLRNIAPKPVKPETGPAREQEGSFDFNNQRIFNGKLLIPSKPPAAEPVEPAPTTTLNVEGVFNTGIFRPPDPTGEVGRNHYVQQTNGGFAVYGKSNGAMLYGPAGLSTIFTGFGGVCEQGDNGDPITLYDQFADRWILSQFAFPEAGTVECIAVSTSGDPLGTYYRYAYLLSTTVFEDYPKLGLWPSENSLTMTVNSFANGGRFLYAGLYAFNRDAMLRGVPDPIFIYFPIIGDGSATPGDVEGFALPPTGERVPIMTIYNSTTETGTLALYRLHPRWDNPAASTFTSTPQFIDVQPFDFTICPASRGACVPQPNTATRLEALQTRPMNKLVYRNFGDHESLLTVQTVDRANAPSGSNGIAGEKWYEIRGTQFVTTTTLYQEGSTDTSDTLHRWMGSINMDHQGDIALGYSASSEVISPSIRYAVRLASDPLGTLGPEATAFQGQGVETGPNGGAIAGRWGDYSHMSVDPTDDCTFWYTQQYYQVSSVSGWRTRIMSFKIPSCSALQTTPTVTPTASPPTPYPTVTSTGTPLACGGPRSVVTGSITLSDPTAPNELADLNPSTCASTPKTWPGTLTRGNPHYDVYTYTNATDFDQCYTLSLYNACGSGQAIQSSVYLTSFNPISPTVNFWADSGGISQQPETYSFSIPAHSTFVVKVNGYEGPFLCDSYTLEVSACNPVGPSPTPTACPMNFSDVQPTDYFYRDVQCVYCLGAVSGYADGTFRPFNNTTRGQMTKIIVIALRIPIVTPTATASATPAATFNDVPPDSPFYTWIETAAADNIVSGYDCGGPGEPCPGRYFRPNANVTRGQLSKIAVVAASQVFGWDILNPATPTFVDVPPDSPFYVYIETAYCHGVISGYADRTFRPGNSAIRAQIAKIVCNTSQNLPSTCPTAPTATVTVTATAPPTATNTPVP